MIPLLVLEGVIDASRAALHVEDMLPAGARARQLSVDPQELADRLFWRAFRNTAQVCMAIKRVYVPEHLRDAIADALAAKAGAVHVG